MTTLRLEAGPCCSRPLGASPEPVRAVASRRTPRGPGGVAESRALSGARVGFWHPSGVHRSLGRVFPGSSGDDPGLASVTPVGVGLWRAGVRTTEGTALKGGATGERRASAGTAGSPAGRSPEAEGERRKAKGERQKTRNPNSRTNPNIPEQTRTTPNKPEQTLKTSMHPTRPQTHPETARRARRASCLP